MGVTQISPFPEDHQFHHFALYTTTDHFTLISRLDSIPMLIDTHCHLISRRFSDDDLAKVIQRANLAGITRMVTQGTAEDDWESSLGLAATFPESITVCLALHPSEVHTARANWQRRLEQLAITHSLAAIGETGLDYYQPVPEGMTENRRKALQRECLEFHFGLAERLGLNIVLHTRDRSGDASFRDALAIAEGYAGRVRPVFHCFIGNQDQLRLAFDKLDALISVTGVVTFKNAGTLPETIAWCPVERLMLETDSPYLAPEPMRGKRNEPALMRHTAEFIAQLKRMDFEQLAMITTQTAEDFFRFPESMKNS